ncbi:homoserine dehydrogenase, partial [Celeribacter marinus]|uniref:homoserine dehydrogenase n=1 Tax=Celeribacter marinus TaxID=1397108 RepID=UPI003F6BF7FE
GNNVTRIIAVMNGTCNYILTRMENEGLSYDEVFAAANALGYLEADPTLDVGGIDAGHKLALLAAIGFGTKVAFSDMVLEGIERITIDDIRQAADMGYKIKLLGVAQMTGRGLEQRMTPCLVPDTSPLGQLDGATNMVVLEGDEVGQIVLRGAGAGMGPTASAVMSDVLDIARDIRVTTFGMPVEMLETAKPAVAATPAPFYLRLSCIDKPGVLAKVTAALGDAGVSIDRMRQYGQHDDPDVAPVLIVTDPASRNSLDVAMAAMESANVLSEPPVAIRIEAV